MVKESMENIYNMEYYAAIKNNALGLCARTWKDVYIDY